MPWTALTSTASGDNYNGTVSTSGLVSIPLAGNNYTLGSVTTVLPRAKFSPSGAVCGSAGIPVTFSGATTPAFDYTLSFKLNGNDQTPVTIHSTDIPYFLPTTYPVGHSSTYQLTAFTYGGSPGTPGVVDATMVTAYDNPTTASAGSTQSVCGITSVTLNGNDPTPFSGLWSIGSGTGGTVITPINYNSQFDGLLPNSYSLKWTISNVSCKSTSTVTIAFTTRPDKPTALAAQTFCGGVGGATINNIVASAPVGSINWYSTNANYPPHVGDLLSSGTALSNGVTYYADAVSGPCISASPLTPVTATLVSQPAGPDFKYSIACFACVRRRKRERYFYCWNWRFRMWRFVPVQV